MFDNGSEKTRGMAMNLGIASMGVSVLMTLMPRVFAKMFGMEVADGARGELPYKAAGARDFAINLGLVRASKNGGDYEPWLMARTLTDGADLAGVLLAAMRGHANARTLIFGLVAATHTAIDAMIWQRSKRNADSLSYDRDYAVPSHAPM